MGSFAVPEEFFDGTTKLSGALGASSNHASKCSIGDIQFNDNAKVHLDSYLVQAYGNSTDFFGKTTYFVTVSYCYDLVLLST